MLSKNINNKKCAPKFVFFNEKKSERFGLFLIKKIDFENQFWALFDSSSLLQFSKFGNFISLQLIFSQKPF